jgi:hypothetical protein
MGGGGGVGNIREYVRGTGMGEEINMGERSQGSVQLDLG